MKKLQVIGCILMPVGIGLLIGIGYIQWRFDRPPDEWSTAGGFVAVGMFLVGSILLWIAENRQQAPPPSTGKCDTGLPPPPL